MSSKAGIRVELQAPILDGYRFVRNLGSGGFGDVYQYQKLSTGASVAIKVLHYGAASSDGGRKRIREVLGRLSHSAQHPNIVSVLSCGFTADGRSYLEMEYCPGGSLAQRIFRNGNLSVPEVLSVGIQLAHALDVVHRAGVVHGCIAPGNVLFGAQTGGHGAPKLGDFRIGGAAEEIGLWTPSREYAAPEVVDTGEGDELSDIFSLAATLNRGLSGRSWAPMPGGDNSLQAMACRVRLGDVLPIGGDVPEALESLLRVSMSRDRATRQRFVPTASVLAQRLQDIQIMLGYEPNPIQVHSREDEPPSEPNLILDPSKEEKDHVPLQASPSSTVEWLGLAALSGVIGNFVWAVIRRATSWMNDRRRRGGYHHQSIRERDLMLLTGRLATQIRCAELGFATPRAEMLHCDRWDIGQDGEVVLFLSGPGLAAEVTISSARPAAVTPTVAVKLRIAKDPTDNPER